MGIFQAFFWRELSFFLDFLLVVQVESEQPVVCKGLGPDRLADAKYRLLLVEAMLANGAATDDVLALLDQAEAILRLHATAPEIVTNDARSHPLPLRCPVNARSYSLLESNPESVSTNGLFA